MILTIRHATHLALPASSRPGPMTEIMVTCVPPIGCRIALHGPPENGKTVVVVAVEVTTLPRNARGPHNTSGVARCEDTWTAYVEPIGG